ncbi:MAG: tRNA lysidine(34) synthetase TilS [Chlamydiota bacterium]
MRTKIEQNLDRFLQSYDCQRCSVLIGLSGGPDSLALFHLLIKLSAKHRLELHVAHLDHGWRPESSSEAAQLKELAQQHGIPFYCKTLMPGLMSGNLEAACREARLGFFRELCDQYSLAGVFLGHHADDQAETVLKRIFEGASLTNLGGLQEEIVIDKVTVWRPLLSIKKSEILDWLKNKGLVAFNDYTNLDPRFSRARLRTDIIPMLSRKFGKDVSGALVNLGKESQNLKHELDDEKELWEDYLVPGVWGRLWDTSITGLPRFSLLKHIIRSWSHATLSRDIVDQSCRSLKAKTPQKKWHVGEQTIIVERGKMFWVDRPLPSFSDDEKDPRVLGPWKLCYYQPDELFRATDWRDIWQGHGNVMVDAKEYFLASPDPNMFYCSVGMTLGEWWSSQKIPLLLRHIAPVLISEGVVIHEFLTGKTFLKIAEEGEKVGIKLEIE